MPGHEQLNERMRELWRKHLPQQLARLETVDRAIQALNTGQLTSQLRQEATVQAHNLAGSLGSFGLDTASEIAQRIETMLSFGDYTGPREISDLTAAIARLQHEIENK